jgi:predicted GIY-YIG superfamily endonuclease
MPASWSVYIGRLEDGRFYVGITQKDPPTLLADHQSGDHARFTRADKLLRIEWTESHPSEVSASRRERQLKKWSHAKKQALVDGNLPTLKSLAKSRRS